MTLPGLGGAAFLRDETLLTIRKDLATTLSRDDWNTIAVRLHGPDIWFVVNDQVAAQVSDSSYDRGYIYFALRRIGDLDDTLETAAVIRNVRISSLAGGDPTRIPAIQGPSGS